MPPLFTVITPTFNGAHKLEDTIQSVLNQGYESCEYCVIDGNSSDHTTIVLESYGTKLNWISEPDLGVYDAMNKGIHMAKGRFLLFLGAGDRLLPGSLKKIASWIAENPSTQPRLIYGSVLKMENSQLYTRGPFSKARIVSENICHQGIFYERTIFEILGDYELKYPVMADWAFNLRCFGDSRIRSLYYTPVVAEFEGGGLSGHTPDVPFAQDREALIRQRLGPGYAIYFRLRQAVKWRTRHFQ